jgi:hypothetical protein
VNTSGSLVDTGGSLVDTSGSLVDTSGVLDRIAKSLVDTSNVLVTVNGQAVTIKGVLEDAEQPADNLGAHDIFERVQTANGVLNAAHVDAGNILTDLKSVNASLKSICNKLGGTC